MISWYNFIIFFCTFLIYLHIIKHISCPNFQNVSQIDFIDNSQIQKICYINNPFVFEYKSYDPTLFNTIDIDSLMKSKYLNVNIFNTVNNNYVVKNFNKAIPLFKKYQTKYFTLNNHTFVLNNNILNQFTKLHDNIQPMLTVNTTYDIISGSIFANTPLNFHSFNHSYIIVIQGKISVKTISYNYANEFDFKFNPETMSYSSPTNIWNFKNKNNLPLIDFEVFPGYILYLPSYALYSIKFIEENTLVWSVSYDSLLSYTINSVNDAQNNINRNIMLLQ